MPALVTGYTDELDELFLEQAFDCPVVVRADRNARSGKITWVKNSAQLTYEDLIRTNDFDRVVYVSHTLEMAGDAAWDIGDLRSCLHCLEKRPDVKFVYVGSNRVLQSDLNSQRVVNQALENLCEFFREVRGLDVMVIRSPYLCNPASPADFLYRTFQSLETTNSCTLAGQPLQLANSMATSDLADLLRRLFTEWRGELGTVDLIPPAGISYGLLAENLRDIFPTATIDFGSDPVSVLHLDRGINVARDYYHWQASTSPLLDLKASYATYQKVRGERPRLVERMGEWVRAHRKLVITAEVLAGAALVQVLNGYFSTGTQFRLIDLRLLYITLIATAYGVVPGLMAALLMCASLAAAYLAGGMGATALLYWFQNWVPFILYIAFGGVIGYVHTKQEEDNSFLRAQNDLLEDRNNYTRSLYEDTLRVKDTYRSQLISSRSGFGKVYDVVQRLSVFEPGEIFLQSVPIIEDMLECDSVAIFTVDDKSPDFARLQVCSGTLQGKVPTSVDLVKHRDVVQGLAEDDVWFNHGLQEDMPVYIACIRDHSNIRVLITLRNVPFDQMNVHYTNQIRVLVRLMGNFLIKAWEFQKANAAAYYIAGTNVMIASRFNDQLAYQRQMAQKHLASYRLLRIHLGGKSVEEASEALGRYVRTSDYLGLGQDGSLYLLALQVDDKTEHFLIDRFRNLGWECEFVRDQQVTI